MIGILYYGDDGYARRYKNPRPPKAGTVRAHLRKFLAHYRRSARAPGRADAIYAHPDTLANMPEKYGRTKLVRDTCMPRNHYLIGVENADKTRRNAESRYGNVCAAEAQ